MSGDGDPLALTAEEREALIGLLRRTLDEARYPFSLAVDAAADAEADAAGIANMLGITLGQTPRDSMLTRYLWEQWASNHARRLGLMPRAA
jgi:hypothetical protein